MTDDPMDALLAPLDPSRTEAPPAPGSVRHASILERAMSDTDIDTDIATPAPITRRPHRWRPYVGAAAAATLVAVVAGAALLGRAADDPDPISVVSSAADSTAEVTSLRATLAREDQHSLTSGTIEVDGDRARIEVAGTYKADGHVEGSTTIIIGRDTWEERLDGGTETYTLDDPIQPFGPSSQAVVAAALSAEDVTVVGHETVRGEPTTHYRITLDDTARAALAGLEPGTVGWFDLDDPDAVRTVDVWVGGDLIRRMQLQGEDGSSTTDYYDFGADIVIERPAWAG